MAFEGEDDLPEDEGDQYDYDQYWGGDNEMGSRV